MGPYRVDKGRLVLPSFLKKEKSVHVLPAGYSIRCNRSKFLLKKSRFLGQFLRPARICSSFMPTTRRRPSFFIFYDGIEERISNPTITLDEGGNHLIFLILYVEIYISV